MVSTTTLKATFLALLAVVSLASGTIVDVAMLFDMEDPTSNCQPDSGKLYTVTKKALNNAGMKLHEDKKHWNGYYTDEDNNVHLEDIEDDDREKFNHAGSTGRRLCDSFCQFMCLSQGRYCSCCSCCGSGRRRNLRSLKKATIGDDVDIAQLQKDAALEAETLLNSWRHHHIGCLADPYKVEVIIREHDEETEAASPKGGGKTDEAAQKITKKAAVVDEAAPQNAKEATPTAGEDTDESNSDSSESDSDSSESDSDSSESDSDSSESDSDSSESDSDSNESDSNESDSDSNESDSDSNESDSDSNEGDSGPEE